jgi:hypothetical protein
MYLTSAFVLAVMSAPFHESSAIADGLSTEPFLIWWGAFHYDDRGYDDGGWDWAPGYFKAECRVDENARVAGGFSFARNDGDTGRWTDGILCVSSSPIDVRSGTDWPLQFQSGDNRRDYTWGDWAYGQWKGECGPNEGVVGVAMDQDNYNVDWILCSPARHVASPKSCHAVTSTSKVHVGIDENGAAVWGWADNRLSNAGGDWDPADNGDFFAKLQCADGEYIKGVSRGGNGYPNVILCCTPSVNGN